MKPKEGFCICWRFTRQKRTTNSEQTQCSVLVRICWNPGAGFACLQVDRLLLDASRWLHFQSAPHAHELNNLGAQNRMLFAVYALLFVSPQTWLRVFHFFCLEKRHFTFFKCQCHSLPVSRSHSATLSSTWAEPTSVRLTKRRKVGTVGTVCLVLQFGPRWVYWAGWYIQYVDNTPEARMREAAKQAAPEPW